MGWLPGTALLALLTLAGAVHPAVSRDPPRPVAAALRVAGAPYPVRERVLDLVDHSRTVTYPGQRPIPRPLTTVVRYPIGDPPVADAPLGRFPLVIFGHGFAVTPRVYSRLLHAWAAAGYVVAAPVFPLQNANAPGGPNESDLGNQPRDVRFVITQLLDAGARHRGPLAGLISSREIAVSGQSDGGVTALAVAYDPAFRDSRVRAAVILSGARVLGGDGPRGASPSPALLAAQGTADTTNRPANTYAFFDAVRRPKFLLRLIGAGHLPPYTGQQPDERIVEEVSIAFLDRYLKGQPGGVQRMRRAADVPGTAALTARP
jgi:dienelactone hydrolase